MNAILNTVMLIDDDNDDNFFHERAIKKNNPENVVIAINSASEALDYLKEKTKPHSDLIFLDINMPGMNGWDFLEEYAKLDDALKSSAIIMMLTTSENSDDKTKAMALGLVSDYITKPLTSELMHSIAEKYFG
jgi:CheY-like chemotaxis protein